jgi:transcription elongation factor
MLKLSQGSTRASKAASSRSWTQTSVSSLNITLSLVLIKSSDKSGMELKAWTKDLRKYFETGENVLVISGLHSGGSGMITAI